MISIVWATATIFFFLPLRTRRQWYCAAGYLPLVREAAQAACQRARRNQMLLGFENVPHRFPIDRGSLQGNRFHPRLANQRDMSLSGCGFRVRNLRFFDRHSPHNQAQNRSLLCR